MEEDNFDKPLLKQTLNRGNSIPLTVEEFVKLFGEIHEDDFIALNSKGFPTNIIASSLISKMMNSIKLSNTLSYWVFKFDISILDKILDISNQVISNGNSSYNGYGIWEGYKDIQDIKKLNVPYLSDLAISGMMVCDEIFSKEYKNILSNIWVNLVKTNTPTQDINREPGKYIYHTHTEISKELGHPKPDYTFVFYLQMPNNLKGDDGRLFIKDIDGSEYSILPKVGECIILNGDTPHAPLSAPDSEFDRIVLAGNVVFSNPKANLSLF